MGALKPVTGSYNSAASMLHTASYIQVEGISVWHWSSCGIVTHRPWNSYGSGLQDHGIIFLVAHKEDSFLSFRSHHYRTALLVWCRNRMYSTKLLHQNWQQGFSHTLSLIQVLGPQPTGEDYSELRKIKHSNHNSSQQVKVRETMFQWCVKSIYSSRFN